MIKEIFNDDWEFTLVDSKDENNKLDQFTQYQDVKLPHDWCVDYGFEKNNQSGEKGGFVKTGIGWYRKFFNISHIDENEKYIISFDGVYRKSDIYINGEKIFHNEYGYIGFRVDITKYINIGLNMILVRCDCSEEPSSRWYNGCGITRNVWISNVKNSYIPSENCFIKSEIDNEKNAVISVDVEPIIFNGDSTDIILNIKNKDGQLLESQSKICYKGKNVNFKTIIYNPELWSYENPYLYMIEIKSKCEDEIDECTFNYGIRKVEWISNKGLFINGKNIKLKGVCNHHDGGCVGAAVPYGLLEKRVLLLKNMGCNALRTSHNPFSPEFYDICDKYGMVVLDECFDGWETKKADHDYGEIFEESWKNDLESFIRRDRNHTCVIGWSIGNEILDATIETTKKLCDFVKSIDNSRIVTCGMNNVSEQSDYVRANSDIGGYNDGGGACFIYDEDHKKRPNQLFIATEAPHTLQTRGFYRTLTWWRDKDRPRMEIPNLTEKEVFDDQDIRFSSSYDNCGVRTCVRDSWSLSEERDYLCGEFRWTGFDYLGEVMAKNWPMRGGNSGIIDTANFPKDHYYLYQSMWKKEHMIYSIPNWTHRRVKEGTIIPVCIYTTCDEAEVFLNQKSYGRIKKEGKKQLIWNIPYEKGELKAVGFIDGKESCDHINITADREEDIEVSVERSSSLEWDKRYFTEITCKAIDKDRYFVPDSKSITSFYPIKGIEFLGSDNGCQIDMTNLKSNKRDMFNGLCKYFCKTEEDFEFIISSICAEKYFKCSQDVFINSRLYKNGNYIESNDIAIRYTTDLSDPCVFGREYKEPFKIDKTTLVKIAVYYKDKVILKLSDIFIEGKKESIVDVEHLNFKI